MARAYPKREILGDLTPGGYDPAVPAWFALRVRTTHEKRIAQLLDMKGYEQFLPLYRVRRRWSDRVKEVDQPLFPGYLFCRFAAQSRAGILKTDGVALVVGIGCVPMPIDDAEILAIQRAVGSGLDVRPHVDLTAGQCVRIDSGPFEGVEGRIVEIRRRHRLVLAISLLQRAISVEIDSAWVSPVSSPSHRPPRREAASLRYAASGC
jgi:transcription antitermination factor NusG